MLLLPEVDPAAYFGGGFIRLMGEVGEAQPTKIVIFCSQSHTTRFSHQHIADNHVTSLKNSSFLTAVLILFEGEKLDVGKKGSVCSH